MPCRHDATDRPPNRDAPGRRRESTFLTRILLRRPCVPTCTAVLGLWWLLSLSPPPAAAQSDPQSAGLRVIESRELTPAGFPLVRARGVEGSPAVDGDVLGDPAYADAMVATGFVQSRPFEGRLASERTEVRIVYDADTIYFGVVCYTEDPGTIIVADSRRDSELTETDSFRVILDTYLDGQNGFVFGTNPAGIEYDAQLTNEGQGSGRFGGGGGRPGNNRQQRGSGGGLNVNWDGAWEVVTRVSDIGWTAEIAIPFRTLRYPTADVQTWGVNFQRNIRFNNEQVYWSPLPRQFNLNRLSLAGELQGIAVPPQRNLQLTPYLLGSTLRRTETRSRSNTGDLGADLKYSITPSMTLDLTANTDFAQVEVDDEQVNLDRFTLFFPEKRPFFLENAGLFSVGQSGAVDVFFSRRIGLGENGEQIPIIGGGRLSGKVGNNTNIGLLNMQTAAIGQVGDENATPGQNFTVARVRQDLANRSNVGAMVVTRNGTGDLAVGDDGNQTVAVDGRWGIGQGGTVSGFLADSGAVDDLVSAGPGGSHALGLSAQHQSERARLSLGFTEVAPDFNPEVGFLARRSYRRVNGSVFTTWRPQNFMGVHELRPHVNHFTVFDFATGAHETQFTHIDNHIEWRNGYEVHTGVNVTREGVFLPFEIFPGVWVPPGQYDHSEAQIAGNTNLGAPVSFNVNSIVGGLFGGERVTLTPSIAARAGETFNAVLEWSYNDLRLPGGDFTTNLIRLRTSYSFNTRMFFQALVQYNDRADLWSSNLRFGLLSDANTGLFVVYNDIQGLGRGLDGRQYIPPGAWRTITVKYSYLFDLLR